MSTTRECGCPPWLEPCVHFDGVVLAMADENVPTPEGFDPKHAPAQAGVPRYGVMTIQDRNPCSCCGMSMGERIGELFTTDDADAARDEFHRREAELLGREA